MSELKRLNAYRIMWVFVYFDLPTETKKDKKNYREFKDSLEKFGFNMLQYSIYIRHCTSRENAEMHKNRVKKILPPAGHVIIHLLTDKQFSMMENYYNTEKIESQKEDNKQLTIW